VTFIPEVSYTIREFKLKAFHDGHMPRMYIEGCVSIGRRDRVKIRDLQRLILMFGIDTGRPNDLI